jgi:hypothetical protein
MSQAGLESFGAYQKARALFDSCYLESISVSTQAEQAGGFSRPFGTWGSHFDLFPGLKAWAIFDCPSGTGQQDLFSGHIRGLCGICQKEVGHTSGLSRILDRTGLCFPRSSILDSRTHD